MSRHSFVALVALTAVLGSIRPAIAQSVPDHLTCYKVKDPQAKAKYTADLGGLITEPGCSIKVPGLLLCSAATKTNVTPTPPGGPDESGQAGRFLCYKVKCPKAHVPPVPWHDQFGDRTLMPVASKLVCAPEIVPASTTTTTISTTTTTLCMLRTTCPAGDDCGTIPDGCGGTLDCGTCLAPETCGGSGTPNVCGCAQAASICDGRCGTFTDNCGNPVTCPDDCASIGAGCTCAGTVCSDPSFTCGTPFCPPASVIDSCGASHTCGVICQGGLHCCGPPQYCTAQPCF